MFWRPVDRLQETGLSDTGAYATRGGGVCAPTAPRVPSPCSRASLCEGMCGWVGGWVGVWMCAEGCIPHCKALPRFAGACRAVP